MRWELSWNSAQWLEPSRQSCRIFSLLSKKASKQEVMKASKSENLSEKLRVRKGTTLKELRLSEQTPDQFTWSTWASMLGMT